MTRWTVVPQNVTRMPQLSYMVPMTPGAAAAQLYNMQDRNGFMTAVTANEKIIGDKADDAMYKATEVEYQAGALGEQLKNLADKIFMSDAFIFGIVAVITIALIVVFRTI